MATLPIKNRPTGTGEDIKVDATPQFERRCLCPHATATAKNHIQDRFAAMRTASSHPHIPL
jgi:hypothetical protein